MMSLATSLLTHLLAHAWVQVRLMNEQFIEFFDTDLVRIPMEHPAWLCGCRHTSHCIQACHHKPS